MIKKLKTVGILGVQECILWLIATICGLLIVAKEKSLLNIYLPEGSNTPSYKYIGAAIVGGIMIVMLLMLLIYCLISFFKSLSRRSNRYGVINLIIVSIVLILVICCFVALVVEGVRFANDLMSYLKKNHDNESRQQIIDKINSLVNQCHSIFLAPTILSFIGLGMTITSTTFCFLSVKNT